MRTNLAVFPSEEPQAADRRDSIRWRRVYLPGRIRSGSTELPVLIRNISCSGALVTCQLVPIVGSVVTFSRGSIEVQAQVVRTDGNDIGLHFEEPIDESLLLADTGRSDFTSAH